MNEATQATTAADSDPNLWGDNEFHQPTPNVSRIKRVGRNDPRLAAADILGYTPLHAAAADGDLTTVTALVAARVPLDAQSIDRLTPLQLAVRFGHVDVAAALVDAGAARPHDPVPLTRLAMLSGSSAMHAWIGATDAEMAEHEAGAWFAQVLIALGYRVTLQSPGYDHGMQGDGPNQWVVDRAMDVAAVLLNPLRRAGLVRTDPRRGLTGATHLAVGWGDLFDVGTHASWPAPDVPTLVNVWTDVLHEVRRGLRLPDAPARQGHTATSLAHAYASTVVQVACASAGERVTTPSPKAPDPPVTDARVPPGPATGRLAPTATEATEASPTDGTAPLDPEADGSLRSRLLRGVEELSTNWFDRLLESDGGLDVRGPEGGAAYEAAVAAGKWTKAAALLHAGYRPANPTDADLALMRCHPFPGDFPLEERAARIQGLTWSDPDTLGAVLALGPPVEPEVLAPALFRAATDAHSRVIPTLCAAGAPLERTAEEAFGAVVDHPGLTDDLATILTAIPSGTPLIAAAETFTGGSVAALLAAGADVSATDADGRTALHYAVRRSNLGPVELLLDAGADPDTPDRQGVRPLHLAMAGPVAIIDALLASGAGASESDRAQCRHAAAHAWLDEHLGIDPPATPADATAWLVRHGHRDRSLLAPAAADQMRLLATLLLAGVDPDQTDGVGAGALHFAARAGAWRVIDPLLRAGATVDLRDGDDATPLLVVRNDPHGRVTTALLRGGANPRAVTLDGKGALHDTQHRSLPGVLAVIAAGGDLDRADRTGVRPLTDALAAGRGDIAGALLAHGADPTPAGVTGREVATIKDSGLLETLLGAPAWPAADALDALTRDLGFVQFTSLAERRQELMARTGTGNLLHAIAGGIDAAAKAQYVLAHLGGSDVQRALVSLDRHGHSPLMAAAAWGDRALVDVLLAFGANPDMVDGEGRDAAAHARRLFYWDVWDRLQEPR